MVCVCAQTSRTLFDVTACFCCALTDSLGLFPGFLMLGPTLTSLLSLVSCLLSLVSCLLSLLYPKVDVRNVTSPMAAALAARLLLRWQCWNAWLLEGGGGGGGGGGVLRGPGQDGFQKLCRLEMRRAAGPLVAVVGAAAANDLVDSCPYSSLLFDAHVDAHMQRDEPHICSARFASSGLNAIVIVGSKVSRTRGDREWMNGDICTASGELVWVF